MMQRMLATLLLIVFSFTIDVSANEASVNYLDAPNWIKQQAIPEAENIPVDDLDGGIYHLLVDDQVSAGGSRRPEYYTHIALYIANRSGLEEASQLNIEFDPVYESLDIHNLRIRREGEIIDRLQSTKLNLLQRESDLDDSILDGRLTASFILEDVRVGDIVEYSYTISGDNPVYQGIFSYSRYVQWSVPVRQQHLRVLWGGSTPLHDSYQHTDQRLEKTSSGDVTEYRLQQNNPPTLILNSERPKWHYPYGRITLSQLKTWREVVEWALPLYRDAIESSEPITSIASQIRRDHPLPAQQISTALQKVQSDIRYFGIELGVNSHQPSPARETLQRRYGDCKDKAVLLVSILRSLGIDASPALVNSRATRRLASYPPKVNAFNHVIVKVQHDGRNYWLDPTRSFQQGELENTYQPNYAYALAIDDDSSTLEPIAVSPDQSQHFLNEYFDLSAGPEGAAELHVESDYRGHQAERRRSDIAEYGVQAIQTNYLDYYRDYYGAIEIAQKIQVENQDNGEVRITEDYHLPELWKKRDDKGKYYASFYAPSIDSLIEKPEQTERTSPFYLGIPRQMVQRIEVLLDQDDWDFDDELIEESNPFFEFRFQVSFNQDKKLLTLEYRLKRLVDHVAPDQLEAYLKARDTVLDATSYRLQKPIATASSQSEAAEFDIYQRILLAYLSVLFIGLGFAITSWRIAAQQRKQNEPAGFFQVSLFKLFLLSLVTHGIYTSYWFYRNWRYIKQRDNSHIMPIARGLFAIFWYYPLAQELINDSQQRYQQNRLFAKPVAIILAIIFLGLAAPSALLDQLYLATLIASILLIIPLANYINHIADDSHAPAKLSRWLPRQYVASIVLLPILLFTTASTLNLIPGDGAIRGDKLWQTDIKFMQRHKVYPANETLQWFYSDALISIRDDGNGFTDERVFSYWVDEHDNFNVESAKFEEIEDIEISYKGGFGETASVTVTRKDDSHFVLYVGAANRSDKTFVKELKQRWRESN